MNVLQEWYSDFLEKAETEMNEELKQQLNFRHKIEEMRNHVVKEINVLFNFLNENSVLDNDISFLEQLLYKRYNNIASGGQSPLSKETLTKLLENKDFMKSLKIFMLTPNHENFIAFQDIWKKISTEIGKAFPKLLCNRVACACTYDVSILPDENKFNKLLCWLVDEGHISINDENYKDWDWFTKNIFLMKELRRAFQLEDVEINKLYSSRFVWALFEHYVEAAGTSELVDDLSYEEAEEVSSIKEEYPSNEGTYLIIGYIPEDCDYTHIPDDDDNIETVSLTIWASETSTISGYANGKKVTLVTENRDWWTYNSQLWQEVIDTFLPQFSKLGKGLTADDLTIAWTAINEEDLDELEEGLYERIINVDSEWGIFHREDEHNGKFYFHLLRFELDEEGDNIQEEEEYEPILVYNK